MQKEFKRISLEELVSDEKITLPVAVSDVEDLDVALSELDDSVDTISETADETNQLIEVSEIAQQEGTDVVALEMLKVIQQDFLKRSGLKIHSIGTESYVLAQEGIIETFKHLYDAIVKAIQNAICWLKDFFSHFFEKVKKLIKFCEELIDSAKSNTITPFLARIDLDKQLVAESGYIQYGPFSKYLRRNGSLIGGHTLAREMAKFLEETEQLLYDTFNDATLVKVNAIIKEIVHYNQHSQKEQIDEKFKELIAELPAFQKSVNQDNLPSTNMVRGEMKLFIGDKSVYSLSKKEVDVDDSDGVKLHYNVYVADASSYKELAENAKHTAMTSLSDIVKLAERVLFHLKQYEKTDEVMERFTKLSQTVGQIKADKWSDGVTTYHPLKAVNELIKTCVNVFIKTGTAIRSHDLAVCQAALQFATISLKIAK